MRFFGDGVTPRLFLPCLAACAWCAEGDRPAAPPDVFPAQASQTPAAIDAFTLRDRARYHVRRTFAPQSIGFGLLGAGIQTWRKNPEGWGADAEGFAQRFGMRMSRGILSNGIAFGLGAALGDDPRYRPSLKTGFGARFKHAVGHSFTHYDGNGRRIPAYSRFAGNVGSNVITKNWFPPGDDRWRDVGRRSVMQLGWPIAWNLLREFTPDIKRKLRK